VAGSKVPAEKGELISLVGGEKDDVTDCILFFDVIGKKYIHAGKNGKGTSLKMVFNLLLGQAMYAFSEGMALGESLGIDKEMLFDTLIDSPVVAPFIKLKRKKMEQNEYEAEFPLKWMQKDLHLASETGFEHGVGLPAVNVIKEIYALIAENSYAPEGINIIGYENKTEGFVSKLLQM
jgi:3-hydroxyisobutyrate dehydrogenase/glyoxylate/succinic semialdehyde reductase